MKKLVFLLLGGSVFFLFACQGKVSDSSDESGRAYMNQKYRPQYHFSPERKWTNDPNGMVYHEGTYHLFFQHYPEALHWGPMHWGHATAGDLFHWEHKDIALYPDSIGYIFSGSAVVDKNNTTGFQSGEEKPLVAIFTHHDPDNDLQVQSLAYSTDGGKTWTKYKDNPVIENSGIKDFRDPKVFWHEPTSRWIMVLAAGDHVRFYSSPNLKEWNLESKFGKNAGAHGGVWECPDLFPLALDGDEQNMKWVLLVSINPGAPNGGSGTQYFVGDFDGHRFTNELQGNQWIDYGTDNYAGVTWSNTPKRKIFIGWMNNWTYAEQIPTSTWRGAMTLPRRLTLKSVAGEPRLVSQPVKEIQALQKEVFSLKDKRISENSLNKDFVDIDLSEAMLQFRTVTANAGEIKIRLYNKDGEKLDIGFRRKEKEVYIDRRDAGVDSFHVAFPKIQNAPMSQWPDSLNLEIYLDRSSVELFVNGGERVMTNRIFSKKPYSHLEVMISSGEAKLEQLRIFEIESVWRKEQLN
ncbi:MAG: glycoside hydrolase family 32 protein [Bacteroidales bacterium]|nr:glycoside hydrolase family 32 protein [Bacteroidales bacterium]